jgi:hypothetical protein
MTISRLCLGLMFNEYVSILLSIHSRDARERETSPSATEAATSRSYLPVNYERVRMIGTLVPAIMRSAPQKKGKTKKKVSGH